MVAVEVGEKDQVDVRRTQSRPGEDEAFEVLRMGGWIDQQPLPAGLDQRARGAGFADALRFAPETVHAEGADVDDLKTCRILDPDSGTCCLRLVTDGRSSIPPRVVGHRPGDRLSAFAEMGEPMGHHCRDSL